MEPRWAGGKPMEVAAEDDLRKRVEMLERIVLAMASGQQFSLTLDEHGRPQIWTELPPSSLPPLKS